MYKRKAYCILNRSITDKIVNPRKSKDLIEKKTQSNENHNKLFWYNYSF